MFIGCLNGLLKQRGTELQVSQKRKVNLLIEEATEIMHCFTKLDKIGFSNPIQ